MLLWFVFCVSGKVGRMLKMFVFSPVFGALWGGLFLFIWVGRFRCFLCFLFLFFVLVVFLFCLLCFGVVAGLFLVLVLVLFFCFFLGGGGFKG